MNAPKGGLSMPDPSAGEIGGIFAGVVALLVALGKGIGWLINLDDRRQSTRHAKLDAWHEELKDREREIDRKQDDLSRQTEVRLRALARWAMTLQQQVTAAVNAHQLVAAGLRQALPDHPALGQADELLKAAFPLDPAVPPALAALLGELADDDARGRTTS